MIRLEIAEGGDDIKPSEDKWKILEGEPLGAVTIKTLRTGQVNPLHLSIDDARRVGGIKKRIQRLIAKYERWVMFGFDGVIYFMAGGVDPTKAQMRRVKHILRLMAKSYKLQEQNK